VSAGVDLDRYFARVGFSGSASPSVETLRRLHALHTAAIPFENLAAFLGEPISLDPAALQAKLLTPGRGGWCFEHNMLFSLVLEALGLRVTRLAARVRWNVPPEVVTARSHMLMRVEVEGGEYIADVGFGGLTLTAPLRLEPDVEQATPHEPHRLARAGNGYRLEACIAGEWQVLYLFDLQEQLPVDYEVSNWYLAHHPRSQFVNGIIAARAAPEGRHALRNTRYSVYRSGGETERRHLSTVDEFRRVLEAAFHIRVPETPVFEERLATLIAAHPPA
jgi:N-hydroxyarylamine O-acetyltransferase